MLQARNKNHLQHKQATMTLLRSLFILANFFDLAKSSATQQLRGSTTVEDADLAANQRRQLPGGTVVCRITVDDTEMEDGSSIDTTVCIPIKDGKEWGRSLPITLPESIVTENQRTINGGRYVVEIADAGFTHSHVALSQSSNFNVLTSEDAAIHYSDPDAHRRVLGDRKLAASGTVSVSIVRVSVKGAKNSISKDDMLNAWFGEKNSFKSQMEDCSFGTLKITQGPFFDLKIVKTMDKFTSRYEMQEAIEKKLKKIAKMSPESIADKVIFCYPPGSPGTWLASAFYNWYKAMFNDKWCISLTGQMHEVGHTVGLLHSSNSDHEYGDVTGYMGFSGGDDKKCYNGVKNWQLGWYDGHRWMVSGSTTVRLAAFVDYQSAADNEPVLIEVNKKYYAQYNRAKNFNSDTGWYKDQVTITILLDNGNSRIVGGIGVGQSFNEGGTVITVCSAGTGRAGADVVNLAIGQKCP